MTNVIQGTPIQVGLANWWNLGDNNGSLLKGYSVHYKETSTSPCQAATIIAMTAPTKIDIQNGSPWNGFTDGHWVTITVNLNAVANNGAIVKHLGINLSGLTGPEFPNWHVVSHDPKMVPPTPPWLIAGSGWVADYGQAHQGVAPLLCFFHPEPVLPPPNTVDAPTADFTGCISISQTGLNDGQPTWFCWCNGAQTYTAVVDIADDYQNLVDQYGSCPPLEAVTEDDVQHSLIKFSTYTYNYNSMIFDIAVPGVTQPLRGVQASVPAFGFSMTGLPTGCGGTMDNTASPVLSGSQVNWYGGNVIGAALVNQCLGTRFALFYTIESYKVLTILGRVQMPTLGSNYVTKIDQVEDTFSVANMMTNYINSPEHLSNLAWADQDMMGVGFYRASNGRIYNCQIFAKNSPCSNTLTNAPTAQKLWNWQRNTFSTAAEQQMYQQINSFRTGRGLSTMKVNSILSAKARDRARDMAVRDYFSHNIPDASGTHLVFDELNAAHFCYNGGGENIQWVDGPRTDWWVLSIGNISGGYVQLSDPWYKNGVYPTSVGVGLTSHAGPNIVIPKHTYLASKSKIGNNSSYTTFGLPYPVTRSPMCGQSTVSGGLINWTAGQNVSCT